MVPLIARATNAAFILHIFAVTGEDGRKLMWTDLRLVLSCLAWRKGLQTLLIIRRQSGRAEHRLRERSRLTQLYVKTNRWHVLLERVGEELSPAPHHVVQSPGWRGVSWYRQMTSDGEQILYRA